MKAHLIRRCGSCSFVTLLFLGRYFDFSHHLVATNVDRYLEHSQGINFTPTIHVWSSNLGWIPAEVNGLPVNRKYRYVPLEDL